MNFLSVFRFILDHPLNRHKPLEAMLRFLKWQLGSRLVACEVVYPWINGAKMIVRNGETGFTQNIYCGLQEFPEMAFVLHALTPDDLFVDVGANIGAYTILAGAVAGARVISFEPVPATFERLYANLRINQLENRVVAMNIGIGRETGALYFTCDQDTMNHVISPSDTSKGTEVKVNRLDNLLEAESPACIKIDVEGFETRVLEGAKNTLQKDSLHSLIIELNGHAIRYGFDESKIISLLSDQGFKPYAYNPFNRSLTSLANKEHSPGNNLFIRDLQSVQKRVTNAPKYSILGTEI